jgi:fructose/tagatose bisphosphate aldolase
MGVHVGCNRLMGHVRGRECRGRDGSPGPHPASSRTEKATEAGFDESLFDGPALPFEENIHQTKRAVEAIKSIDPAIVVAGEIGHGRCA